MKWILFWFLIGLILANSLGCVAPRKNRLTFAAYGVESNVEWRAEYSLEY